MTIRRLLGCLALCLPAATLAAEDQLYNLAGSEMARGRITSMSATAVVVSSTAGDRTFPANQIRNIVFEEDTGEIRTLKNRVVNGQLEQALTEVNAMNLAQVTRPEARADLDYIKAYCMAKLSLQGVGDKVAAGGALVGFIRTHTSSYHLFEAAELTGHVSQAMGRFDVSAQYFSKLAAAPWPDVQMKGKVLEAGALIAQGDFTKAAVKYDEVLGLPNNDAASNRQKVFATIGKAYCTGQAGKPDEGISLVNEVIKEGDSQDLELFGRAYNALGVCHLKAGRKKDAVRAFLHTDLMFNSNADAHAEALYHLSGLWDELQQAERALKARSLLKSRYASTAWANK